MPESATYRNPHAHETIGTVRQMYDGALSPELAVHTFRNIDRLFPTRTVRHGAVPYPLPLAARPLRAIEFTARGQQHSIHDYVRLNRVTGLLVLKNGHIVLERYEAGNTPSTRWMSMSIAKSITSTLIGMAWVDGAIRTLDDSVTRYVPSLRGSAYDGVTVRQLLTMTSGVRWNETYTDATSDRRRLLEAQLAQQPGAAMALMQALPRAATPGTVHNYSTGETQVASEVLRGAVHMSLSAYLSEKVWQPFGMESDAAWWLDAPDGHELGGTGISATLRDYGRFGLFFMNGGVIAGRPILAAGWRDVAGAAQSLASGERIPYGLMWWPIDGSASSGTAGAFAAIGIFGQALYINPRENVVIVQWCAQTQPAGGDVIDEDTFFAAVTLALR